MAGHRGVYILDAKRTPFGKFWGALKDIPAPKLVSPLIMKLRLNNDYIFSPQEVDAIFMGEVLTAGVGQNPARQAAIYAGLPVSCPAVTVNKVCSSSLIALELAVQKIRLGEADIVIAGGMESMSRAPYLVLRSDKVLGDKRYGLLYPNSDLVLTDSMMHDGLADIYDPALPHMGKLADMCARVHGISREEQEKYAYYSFAAALFARNQGYFHSQIVPVLLDCGIGKDVQEFKDDEGVREPDAEKMKKLQPAFENDGTVTAATSSQISDGAACLLLASGQTAKKFGEPLARIVAFATHSQDPQWYTTAPVGAIKKVLEKTGLSLNDINLFEINEAFAVVPLYAMRELGIPKEKVNIWGGAIALGHPIGASGARIAGNLAYALRATGGRYGIAVACNGGGEAVAVLIENIQR